MFPIQRFLLLVDLTQHHIKLVTLNVKPVFILFKFEQLEDGSGQLRYLPYTPPI